MHELIALVRENNTTLRNGILESQHDWPHGLTVRNLLSVRLKRSGI